MVDIEVKTFDRVLPKKPNKLKLSDFPSIILDGLKVYDTTPTDATDGQGLLSLTYAGLTITDVDDNRVGYVRGGTSGVVISYDKYYFQLEYKDIWHAVVEALEKDNVCVDETLSKD